MFLRRAAALSAIAVVTAFAGDAPSGVFGAFKVLTLRKAIDLALQNNIDIQWHKTDLKLQDAQVRLAWGTFDPAFSLDSSYQLVRTPQNPTTITSADTAQQILLQQEAIAEAEAAIAAQPTPVPLPGPSAPTASTTTTTPTAQLEPFIFQNRDFLNSVTFGGTLPLGTIYKFGVQANHLDDTVLGLDDQFLPSNTFFAGLSVDQPLLQGLGDDANLAPIRIGRKNRQISYNNWSQEVLNSVASVMSTYFDMILAQETMQLRQESMKADQALANANGQRVNVGLMTPIDVRQAEVEVSADQDDLLEARNLLIARSGDMKKLIYRGVEQDDGRSLAAMLDPLTLPVPVLDRDTLLADAFRNRLDYSTAVQQAQIEDVRLKYYRNQLLPKIDLVATLGINGLSTGSYSQSVTRAIDGQAPEYIFGIQGTIPWGNVTARANRDSSIRTKQEALWKIKQVELAIVTDIDTAIDAIRTNEQRVETARQARKFAEQVVNMQDQRLEAGQGSTLDVLDDRRRLYDAQSRELGAVDDLNKAIIQLWVSDGTLLQREAITLVDDDREGPSPKAGGAH